jgi:addiction module HigA family antidote
MNRKQNERVSAFHPGYYVGELLEEEGITQTEFAKRLGTTDKTLSKLLNGLIPMSNELASKLSLMTGTSIALWLNLQTEYEKRCMDIENAEQ